MPTQPLPKLERQIALPLVARLRWLAVVGQVGATVLAMRWLHLDLPLTGIAWVIGLTVLSNLIIQVWPQFGQPARWVFPAVILLDVLLFTVLLYCTGGTGNPFSVLYAIHVAMAVVVLSGFWTWIVVGLSIVGYALVRFRHIPLSPPPTPSMIEFGNWISLTLVMVLIAYFSGRVMRSLLQRERELAEARDQTSRSAYLASLTTLAAGAAHELGTPLGTIAVVSKELELAAARGADASAFLEDSQLIRREVDRCRAILNRMRVDVIEDANTSHEALAALLQGLLSDLRPSEASRVQVVSVERDDLRVWRSRSLRRALGVLLRNAFDASPADAPVQLLFTRSDARMIFEVRDRGSGMPADVLRRAGEPFFTTKPLGAGMGLGLFLVRLVADTYGGRFELFSTPGEGTRSILDLPDRSTEQASNDTAATDSAITNARRGRRRDISHAPG